MTPKPRDWDDVVRRRSAKDEEAYQRKIDMVMKVLEIEPKVFKRIDKEKVNPLIDSMNSNVLEILAEMKDRGMITRKEQV